MNKIKILDKGHIELFSTSMSNDQLRELMRFYSASKPDKIDQAILAVPQLHLKVRCPLFVQLTFGHYQLTTTNKKLGLSAPEAYIPDINDIGALDLEASTAIQSDIAQTTGALLINPKAYQTERCDKFISQLITPISVYNEVIVSGSLKEWINYILQKNLPGPIEAYRVAIEAVLLSEWSDLKTFVESSKRI